MFIKSVIIDGFKSYGTRTEINGFDPEFNAITGLNGTGKSNILDSICFVLGISNLTHVSANTLQDQIYKSGQAGVTKASVTIVFDNSDSSKSPKNYEQHEEITVTRQIVVAGKNCYMINGSIVTNRHVTEFFNSIQLNVNNPHFLIMQGRITKVLNMEPPEILSMIGEAAGIRMYEMAKMIVQWTIERKDGRLKEMDEKSKENIEEKLRNYEKQYGNAKKVKAECKELLSNLDKQIGELQAKRDAESGGNLRELDAQLKEVSSYEAESSATVKSEKENLSVENKQLKQLEKTVRDDEKAFATKRLELGNAQSVSQALQEIEKQDAEALAVAMEKFEAVSSGFVSVDEGENATLHVQLISTQQQLSETKTEVAQCNKIIKHYKLELEKKKPLLKKTGMAFAEDRKDLDIKEKELESLKAALQRINYEDGLVETLQQQLRAISDQTRSSTAVLNNLLLSYPQLIFKYNDPEPNFNRRKVRGLLCKLFKVKDARFNRAVQTVAGGKLYHVVVDDETISEKLIKQGNLRRTTFVPLNKIQGSSLNQRMIQKAEEVRQRVFGSLVDYDPIYESVMSWSFGQTFICTTTEAAKRVSFHPDIQKKTIDLNGNVFDPAGIISGGAVDMSPPILSALVNICEAENRLNSFKTEYVLVNQKLTEVAPTALSYENLKLNHELCLGELERVKARLQDTPHYQLQQELEELESNLKAKQERIVQCNNFIKEKLAKVKELESKMKNMKAIRERAVSDAEAAQKMAKKNADDSSAKWNQREQQVVKEKKALVKSQKDAIGQNDEEIQQLVVQKGVTIKRINDEELSLKSLANYIKTTTNEAETEEERIKFMLRTYNWIAGDGEYFGQPNGMYDFEANDPQEACRKIERLNKLMDEIERNVNPKALDMLSAQEELFQEIMNKKGKIEEDRFELLPVIKDLDVIIEELIKKVWEKVNHDFNSILSSLLPSAQAKLKPVDGKGFMDGLEVKVGFDGLWIDSLDELSGGQRSSVALSLILAMLLFKPAPLYILDEVDAALDPSQTQNIGQLLKAHFTQSQFIVVSLKEGMLNNANVLFRTSFVDGMSAVTRTIGGARV